MAEPFKNMYNKQFFDLFTKDLRLVIDDLMLTVLFLK